MSDNVQSRTAAPVEPTPAAKDPRVYFAAERTFLAWIRTGLAMMGFGFVLARFGLFLREMQVAHIVAAKSTGFSVWAGTALIFFGVVVNVVAAAHHISLITRLNTGIEAVGRPSAMALGAAILLAIVGLSMVGYLLLFR